MAKTIEELEAESIRIGKQFETDFENTSRTFFRSVSEFSGALDEAPVSDAIKLAIMKGMVGSLEKVQSIVDRVATEEGIA